jgi:hypothetical protein
MEGNSARGSWAYAVSSPGMTAAARRKFNHGASGGHGRALTGVYKAPRGDERRGVRLRQTSSRLQIIPIGTCTGNAVSAASAGTLRGNNHFSPKIAENPRSNSPLRQRMHREFRAQYIFFFEKYSDTTMLITMEIRMIIAKP